MLKQQFLALPGIWVCYLADRDEPIGAVDESARYVYHGDEPVGPLDEGPFDNLSVFHFPSTNPLWEEAVF